MAATKMLVSKHNNYPGDDSRLSPVQVGKSEEAFQEWRKLCDPRGPRAVSAQPERCRLCWRNDGRVGIGPLLPAGLALPGVAPALSQGDATWAEPGRPFQPPGRATASGRARRSPAFGICRRMPRRLDRTASARAGEWRMRFRAPAGLRTGLREAPAI